MTWKIINISNPGTSVKFGADDTDKINKGFSGVDVDDYDINSDFTIRSGKSHTRNPANTKSYTTVASAITVDVNETIPLLTGNDTRVYQSHTQTLANKTLDATCDVSAAVGGSAPIGFDYIIYKSGSNTVAYNTATKTNQYTSSDARTTFSNVSTALNTAGGGSCFVKKGTYTMVNAASNITMRDNCNWVGEDRDLTILVNQSTTDQMWKRTGSRVTNFKISNMKMTSTVNTLIYAAGSVDCKVDNCIFEFSSATSSPKFLTFFDNVSGTVTNENLSITNCIYQGDTNGQDMMGGGSYLGGNFSNNVIRNGGTTGGQGMGVGGTTIGSKFNNNYFYNIKTNPIGLESDCESNEVNGNVFVGCGGRLKLSQIGSTNKSIHNMCCNNVFEYGDSGIEDGWGEGDIICNNIFRRVSSYGIKGTLSASIICNNVFDDINYNNGTTTMNSISYSTGGINLVNNSNFTTPSPNIIDGNTFIDSGASFNVPTGYTKDGGTSQTGDVGGILIDTNFTDTLIGPNNIFTNTLSTVVDEGTRTNRPTSPSQITSDQNNYAPTGWNNSKVLRLDGDASFRTITGLGDATQYGGQTIKLRNISANTILLSNQNASSTAANRFDFNGYDYPLFAKSEINLTYDKTLTRWIGEPSRPYIPTSTYGSYTYAECTNNNSGNQWLNTAASGGSNSNVAGVANHQGVIEYTLGTSTTGSASYRQTTVNNLLGNSWYWRFDCIYKVVALSDGTNTYTLRIGFIDSGSAESTDGVFLRYTDSVNSGNWVCVTRSNSTESTSNSSSAVQTSNYQRATIIVNPAGNLARFYINGTQIGSDITSNIPTGSGRQCGPGFMFLKSAGTTDNAAFDLDSIEAISYSPTIRGA